jgi:hypothetical protein
MSALPVAANLHVIEHRTYLHTAKRWIALCVVQDEYGIGIKFYKWAWREVDAQWKVDLARFSIIDVNLFQIAADAAEFARRYDIKLKWSTLEAISKLGVSVQTTPRCPHCDSDSGVESVQTNTTWHC